MTRRDRIAAIHQGTIIPYSSTRSLSVSYMHLHAWDPSDEAWVAQDAGVRETDVQRGVVTWDVA